MDHDEQIDGYTYTTRNKRIMKGGGGWPARAFFDPAGNTIVIVYKIGDTGVYRVIHIRLTAIPGYADKPEQ